MRWWLTSLVLALLTTSCTSREHAPRAEPSGVPDSAWRTETWAGLSVDVPASWGYGAAPIRIGRSVSVCGPVAGVGRPVLRSDVCAIYPWLEGAPAQGGDYVWLGADLEPGTVGYDDGLVQETVAVEGTTLTVASRHAGLRARILGSARPATACGEAEPAPGEVEVCGYRRTVAGERVLGFAERAAADVVEAVVAAARHAPAAKADPGCGPGTGELVELRVSGRSIILDLGCGTVDPGDGRLRLLTDEAVEPWASPMARATLTYLIGPQG
jgi:hypothetical protein